LPSVEASLLRLSARLGRGAVVLLDGPTGTELGRRGVDLSPPLWSAWAIERAPDRLREIHRDYLRAGAQLLSAATFRTNPRALRAAGIPDPETASRRLARQAIGILREAMAEEGREGTAFVAGSIAPVEDCYRPDLVPSSPELEMEHSCQAEALSAAGADLLLVETMNLVREAEVATRAAASTGLPVWTSFVVGPKGRLLSGEPIEEGAVAAKEAGASAILVNCSALDDTTAALVRLAPLGNGLLLGAYANAERPRAGNGLPIAGGVDAARYVAAAREWRRLGAKLLGSCCGTGPEHIAALAEAFGTPRPAETRREDED
jgi:S-methylmethionine-dependent homocysteine/selenocysteine methylase